MRHALLLCLLATSCSDYALGRLEPDGNDTIVPSTPDDREDSPWDSLDPGSLPDLTFAVLWYDVSDIEAVDEENDQYPCRPGPTLWETVYGDPQLSLVDVRGRVIADVDLPEALFPYRVASLQSVDATHFLLEAPVERELGYDRVVWLVDGLDLTTTELARWALQGQSGRVSLLSGTVDVQVPVDFSDLRVTVMDDTLYLAPYQGGSGTPRPLAAPALFAYDLADPAAPPRVWTLGELIPPQLAELEIPPRAYIQHLRHAGEDLVFHTWYSGPAWDGSDDSYSYRSIRFVFHPDEGRRSWTLDLSGDAIDNRPPPVQRHDETRATVVADASQLRFFSTDRSGVDLLPVEGTCLRPLALLDNAAPTLLYADHDVDGPDDYGTELVVSHRGRDVLRLDALDVGLGSRRAAIEAFTVLE